MRYFKLLGSRGRQKNIETEKFVTAYLEAGRLAKEWLCGVEIQEVIGQPGTACFYCAEPMLEAPCHCQKVFVQA